MNKNGNLAFVQFRNPKAALGKGRVQRTAQRAFMISDLVSAGDVVQRCLRAPQPRCSDDCREYFQLRRRASAATLDARGPLRSSTKQTVRQAWLSLAGRKAPSTPEGVRPDTSNQNQRRRRGGMRAP